jgi:hypothetical protein
MGIQGTAPVDGGSPSTHRRGMTRLELEQKIAAYVVKEEDIRRRLANASGPAARADLERMLRLVTVLLFGLTNKLREAVTMDVAGRPQRATAGAQDRA